MAGITIDKLTELTSPTETTNFLVGGGNAQKMKLSTLLSWIKGKFETHETLNFDDVFTVKAGFTVTGAEVYRRGKRIYATIYFGGTATTGDSCLFECLAIKSAYKKKLDFSQGCFVNPLAGGQMFKPATLMSLGDNIAICTGEANTTYGNDAYPWCTAALLRFEYELA